MSSEPQPESSRSRLRWLAYGAVALALQLVIVAVAFAQVQEANREKTAALAHHARLEQSLADADAEIASVRSLLDNANLTTESVQGRLDDSAAEVRSLEKQITQLKKDLAKAKAAAAPKPPPSQGGGTLTCPTDHRCYTITSTGSSSVDVTYTNKSGGTSQAIGAAVPWFLDLGPDAYFLDFVYVSGQQSGSGTVTCTIWDGRTVYAKGSSTGQYSICTASD